MLKVIAPYVCPRQIVEWRTAGQWRASPYIVPQTTAGWDGWKDMANAPGPE